MNPADSDDENDTQGSTDYRPKWSWYRNQGHDFYRYVKDDDGMIQKVYDDPRQQNRSSKTPKGKVTVVDNSLPVPGSRKATPSPVTFQPLEKPPKFFITENPPKVFEADGEYGPSKLETNNFHSKDSEGLNAWHYSQSRNDLERPLPQTPTPSKLATLYINRNTTDGGFQVWVWLEASGGRGWQPVDLKNTVTYHPEIPSRVLRMTAAGKPSWILQTSLVTERARELKKKRSQSRQRSPKPGSSSAS